MDKCQLIGPDGQVLFEGSYLQCQDEMKKFPHLECWIDTSGDPEDYPFNEERGS